MPAVFYFDFLLIGTFRDVDAIVKMANEKNDVIYRLHRAAVEIVDKKSHPKFQIFITKNEEFEKIVEKEIPKTIAAFPLDFFGRIHARVIFKFA